MLLGYYTSPQSTIEAPLRFFEWLQMEDGLNELIAEFSSFQDKANRLYIDEEKFKQLEITWNENMKAFSVLHISSPEKEQHPNPQVIDVVTAFHTTLRAQSLRSIEFMKKQVVQLHMHRVDAILYLENAYRIIQQLEQLTPALNKPYQQPVRNVLNELLMDIGSYLLFMFPSYKGELKITIHDHTLSGFRSNGNQAAILTRLHDALVKGGITGSNTVQFINTLSGLSSEPIIWNILTGKGEMNNVSLYVLVERLVDLEIIKKFKSTPDFREAIRSSFRGPSGEKPRASDSSYSQYKSSLNKVPSKRNQVILLDTMKDILTNLKDWQGQLNPKL
ncbi:MAG: hypothetical protein HN542_03250 [Flavobacteriales bacterium]|nr:hypothetical protein [Flavobacteriales bacterium]